MAIDFKKMPGYPGSNSNPDLRDDTERLYEVTLNNSTDLSNFYTDIETANTDPTNLGSGSTWGYGGLWTSTGYTSGTLVTVPASSTAAYLCLISHETGIDPELDTTGTWVSYSIPYQFQGPYSLTTTYAPFDFVVFSEMSGPDHWVAVQPVPIGEAPSFMSNYWVPFLGGSLSPSRAVPLITRKPSSRATDYSLTYSEAEALKLDSRVKDVQVEGKLRKVYPVARLTQTGNFYKGTTRKNDNVNWGLLKCTEKTNRDIDKYNGDLTDSIKLGATGKNVDIIISDGGGNGGVYPINPEWDDTNGQTRYKEYNWFKHNPEVLGTPAEHILNYTDLHSSDHSAHVAGTACGNLQGWARDANLYGISYNNYGANGIGYIREFHKNKSINPETGVKNPTIVNMSWGYWDYVHPNDITKIRFQGTTYTPPGTITAKGYSGVCTKDTKFCGFSATDLIDHGNRITTTKPTTPPTYWVSFSPAWHPGYNGTDTIEQVELGAPYVMPYETAVVNGPCTLSLKHMVSMESISEASDLDLMVEIRDGAGALVYFDADYAFAPAGNPAVVDLYNPSISLPNDEDYEIAFFTNTRGGPLHTYTLEKKGIITDYVAATGTLGCSIASLGNPGIADYSSLTSNIGFPTDGGTDDGYYRVQVPWDIEFFDTTTDYVCVGTNGYLTFGYFSGSSANSGLDENTPAEPKIHVTSLDNKVFGIHYGETGVAPNRTYRLVIEGGTPYSVGSVNQKFEYVFYENNTNQIDLIITDNAAVVSDGTFEWADIQQYGIIPNGGSKYFFDGVKTSVDVEVEDAIAEGIIFVGAAGNDSNYIAKDASDPNYNNYFQKQANGYKFYYHRAGTPNKHAIKVGATDHDGALSSRKVDFSNCGSGVDIYAPGSQIISSDYEGYYTTSSRPFLSADDLRWPQDQYSGTSMASPQVCGVIACLLEIYPTLNQADALEYIQYHAHKGEIKQSNNGELNTFTDTADINTTGSEGNNYLVYPIERAYEGEAFPKKNVWKRNLTGLVWPRPVKKVYKA